MSVSIDGFRDYLLTQNGKVFSTLHRGTLFVLDMVPDGLVYTPKSSGKPRKQEWKYIENVIQLFNETHSFHPGDYHEITLNASYILTLLSKYLNRQ